MSTLSNSPSPEHRRHHPVEPPRIDDHEFRPGGGAAEYRAGLALRALHQSAFAGTLRTQDPGAVHLDRHCRRRTTPDLTECQAAAQVGGRLHGDASAARLGVTHRGF